MRCTGSGDGRSSARLSRQALERHLAARRRRPAGRRGDRRCARRAGRRSGPGRRAGRARSGRGRGPGGGCPALTLVAAARASAGVKPSCVSQPYLAQGRGAVIDSADPGVGADPDPDPGRLQPADILAHDRPAAASPLRRRLVRLGPARFLARPLGRPQPAPFGGEEGRGPPAARRRRGWGRRRCPWPSSERSGRRRPGRRRCRGRARRRPRRRRPWRPPG